MWRPKGSLCSSLEIIPSSDCFSFNICDLRYVSVVLDLEVCLPVGNFRGLFNLCVQLDKLTLDSISSNPELDSASVPSLSPSESSSQFVATCS
mmetsp:Transcript_37592/g.100043  ORF Transcript_37592/g.100043 Transcript_37592/m.100043 type:complete len:93 (-) Transcript_37592:412-690(-)